MELRLILRFFSLSGGVYVYGLFLEGAGWDKKQMKLIESQPKVIHTAMPIVHVYAINVNMPRDDKKMQGLQLYQCPVYKKPRRTGGLQLPGFELYINKQPRRTPINESCSFNLDMCNLNFQRVLFQYLSTGVSNFLNCGPVKN